MKGRKWEVLNKSNDITSSNLKCKEIKGEKGMAVSAQTAAFRSVTFGKEWHVNNIKKTFKALQNPQNGFKVLTNENALCASKAVLTYN